MPLPRRVPLPVLLALVLLVGALLLAGCRRPRDPLELEPPTRFGQAAAAEVPAGERGGIEAVDAVLLYRRGNDPCEVLLAGTAGIAAGACGEELSPRVYARPQRVERIQELASTYAPFEIESGAEELEFHGVGERVPNPAEQRMVLELARRLMTESLGLRRAEAYRLAFAWHRQGTGEQPCDDLAIYLSGEAVASSCAYEGVEVSGSLAPEQLAQVYDWVDRLRPFQVEGYGTREENGERETVATRLIFVGRGEDPGEDVTGEISRFAHDVYRTMTDEELARVAAEREREEEQRLLEARQAAGLAPSDGRGQGTQGQAQQRQGERQQPSAAPEPLPPPEPSAPPPAATIGLAEPDEAVDPGPDEDEREDDDGDGASDGGSDDDGNDGDDGEGGTAG